MVKLKVDADATTNSNNSRSFLPHLRIQRWVPNTFWIVLCYKRYVERQFLLLLLLWKNFIHFIGIYRNPGIPIDFNHFRDRGYICEITELK